MSSRGYTGLVIDSVAKQMRQKLCSRADLNLEGGEEALRGDRLANNRLWKVTHGGGSFENDVSK